MVDQLLQVAEGDEKDQIDVIYAEYEATFAADELLGAPGGEEGVEEHAAALGEFFGEGDEGAVGALGALGALARVALEGAGEESTQEGEEEGTQEGDPAEEGTQRGGFRLRGKSILFTYNWNFLGRRFPDGTPAAASEDALWELWRVWKRLKKAERQAAIM